MRRQLAGSYQLHPAHRTFIPPHMQVLLCHPLAYQDLRYCCNLLTIDLLSVLTPEDLPMKFLCPLRKSMPLVALLHLLHSGEGHRRPLSLMNLAICPLTLLLLPWKLIARHTLVVVIIHLENRLVGLLVKVSYCSILRHNNRRLMILEIRHTRIIITTHISTVVPGRSRDQCHQLHTAAVPALLRSNLTQLVNLLDLRSLVQRLLNALLACMHRMSKINLQNKKVVGTDDLPQAITVIGISVAQGIVVTTRPTHLSHFLSIHHALHEHIVPLNLLHGRTRLVTGITSLV